MLPHGPTEPPEKQTFRWFATPYDFLSECAARFGDPFTLEMSGYGPHLCVSHPDAVREVFTAPQDALEAGAGNDPLRPLLGDGSLLLLDGPEHHRHRKILAPAFAEPRIEACREAIEGIADRTFSEWPEGAETAVHPAMVRISLEVILRFVLGASPRTGELSRRFTELLQRPSLSLKLFERGDVKLLQLDELLLEEIRSRSAQDAVIDLLIRDGTLDERAIRDELVTLIVAGHETTASSLAWATFFILHTPGVVERIRSGDPEYLDAVSKEALRMRPVIPVVSRRVAQPLEIAGYRLERGMHVMPCIYLTHHRAEVYPEPERFRPERFLEQRPTAYQFLPFGGGSRRCIGMSFALYEMRLVLLRLIAGFELELLDRHPPRPVRSALMIVPSGGTRVRVRRRQP